MRYTFRISGSVITDHVQHGNTIPALVVSEGLPNSDDWAIVAVNYFRGDDTIMITVTDDLGGRDQISEDVNIQLAEINTHPLVRRAGWLACQLMQIGSWFTDAYDWIDDWLFVTEMRFRLWRIRPKDGD